MTYLIGYQIQVADYEIWKQSFDASLAMRQEAGEVGFQLFRSADDPNNLTLVCEWDDPERARAFLDSPELRQAQEDAGVVGMPQTQVLELIEEY